MNRPLELSGHRFGALLVLEKAESPDTQSRWRCRCDCGETAVIRGTTLRTGHTRSCGCLRKTTIAAVGRRAFKHGHGGNGGSPTLRTWRGMVKRCTDPEDKDWPRYGGRGIKVCPSWEASFEAFLADLGARPAKMTLERRDNDRDYAPDNCFWASRKAQANNRSSNINLTINGETLSAAAWADRYGMPRGLIYTRLRRGWPASRIFEPARFYPAG